MLDILNDPARTGVVIVTNPAEMPVTEAIELAGALREKTSVDLAAVVVNRVLPELFGRGEEALFERLREPGPEAALVGEVGAAHRAGGRRARRQSALHRQCIWRPREVSVPPYLMCPSCPRKGPPGHEAIAEALGVGARPDGGHPSVA
jgi:anion-transporting  ArsA/GET3 family ATPase